MTPREYLECPENLRREIRRKQERIDSLRMLASRLTAVLEENRVRSSPDPTRMQALLAEADAQEREMHLLEDALVEAMVDTTLYISGLPDHLLFQVLECRYVSGWGWNETACRLGYNRGWIHKLHLRALSLLPPPPEVPEDAPL